MSSIPTYRVACSKGVHKRLTTHKLWGVFGAVRCVERLNRMHDCHHTIIKERDHG